MSLQSGEALRALIGHLKPGQWPVVSKSGATLPPRPSRTALITTRPKVPLSEEEWTGAQALAEREGMSVPRWIVALIRAHLSGRPQLGAASIDALRHSNLAVQAIGRNLNQIARALNSIQDHLDHGRLRQAEEGIRAQRGEEVRALLEQVKRTIDAHIPRVSAVLTENVNRWRVRLGSGEGGKSR